MDTRQRENRPTINHKQKRIKLNEEQQEEGKN